MNDFLEFDELKRWVLEETRKVSERLDREGAVRGLDTNREAYAYIHETFDRRLKEIVAKYKSLKQEQPTRNGGSIQ